MNRQFTDITLADPRRKNQTATRRTSYLSRNAQATDAAFAELDSTTLRLDEPLAVELRKFPGRPCDNLTLQLASQLEALDRQRERLTRLLNDLQPLPLNAV